MAEKIGQGIEYIKVGKLHVVRIVRDLAKPFVIGPLINKVYPSGGGDRVQVQNLSSLLQSGVPSLYPRIKGKQQKLVPLWVSNGTFFGIDNDDDYEDKVKFFVSGPVLQNGPKQRRANAPKSLGVKSNRWIQLHNLYASGDVEGHFVQMQGYASAYNIRTGKVPYLPINAYKSRRWQWASGGAACLIENGVAHTESYWGSNAGGKFSEDQWYSTGPVIAINSTEKTVIYLIMETSDPREFFWRDMTAYLQGDFLRDINHPADGKIQEALVYDGASARQLWVKGKGEVFASDRGVPQFLCLWGQE